MAILRIPRRYLSCSVAWQTLNQLQCSQGKLQNEPKEREGTGMIFTAIFTKNLLY